MRDSETAAGSAERQLFVQALEKPAGKERAAFLDGACGDSPELRRRLEALLEKFESLGTFLQQPAVSASGAPSEPQDRQPAPELLQETAGLGGPSEKPGDRIGRYKLLQKIGEGGCGIVYMAEQEEPVRRRVALKVIKLGMDTRQVIARFEAERQALAMMDHPNIAKVLDAGATETGRPYFVMELVRGIKITEYCDQNNLSTRQRLDLFIPVCQAIQHAHQKGIIHRDIKPSNILVTLHDGVPVPKVIDFGIAKATEGRLTNQTLFTAFEQFIGTPAYMSPEQAEMSGLDIDTRSDIYSLGVLLYELLTGRTPLDTKELLAAGLDELRRTIREKDPLRPSTRLRSLLEEEKTTAAKRRGVDVPKLIHLLSGDLDWIVMKCLEKDRTRRYETANGLVMDIQRHLSNEPVVARPPSASYRLQKLVRRHKLTFAAAGAVMTALTVGGVFSTWQAIRARRAERQAKLEAHRALKAEATAKEQSATAEQQRLRAEAGEATARQRELEARRNLYASDMILANQALEINNIGRARALLGRWRESAFKAESQIENEADPRGWEWRYLWQQSQTDELDQLGPCPLGAHTVVLSPDGKLLVAKHGTSTTFQVWDIPARRVLGTNTAVLLPWCDHFCAFSSDSSVLAAAGAGGVVRRLHPRTLQAIAPALKVAGEVEDVSYSPDGKTLAIVHQPPGANTRGIAFFDAGEGRILRDYPLPRYAFSIAQDQRTAAAGLADGTIELYELATGTRTGHFQFAYRSPNLALSPDGTHLVIFDEKLHSELWEVSTPSQPKRLDWVSTHFGRVRYCVFSPDGRRFATTSYDQVVKLWEVSTGKEIKTLRGHESIVFCASFMPDGQTLVTGSKDETIRFWSTQPPSEPSNVRRLSSVADESQVWLAPSGDALLVVRSNAVFSMWNVLEWGGTEEQPIPLPEFKLGAVSPGGRFAAFGNELGGVLLWDTAQRRAIPILQTNAAPIARLQFSGDGSLLAVTGENSWTGIWSVARTNLVHQFPHRAPMSLTWFKATVTPPGSFYPTCFSRNGELYAEAEGEGCVEIWNVVQRRSIGFWNADKKFVSALAFSPDGNTIATSGYDDLVHLWDVTTQSETRTYRSSNLASLFAVAFSPDGRRLVGGTPDGPVKLWDVESAQELLALKGHKSGVDCVSFLADGDTLVSASGSEVIRWVAPKLAQVK